jgi:predicted dehydrogenase
MSTQMSTEFRWGILASGGIAQAFARDLSYFNHHIVAAVGSRSQESADSFAAEFPGCTAYSSYEALVADPTLDAIYVASPHPYHVSNTVLALNAGKPVLCEKPLTINAAEARQMKAAADANGVALMEAMWARFLPHMHKVREILASGILGDIWAVEADHGQRLSDYANPRHWEPSLGGGALLDLGIYPISFAHMVLGVPDKITSSATFTDKGVDASSTVIFDYKNGAQAILTSNMMVSTPCRATICGTLGKIEIDRTFYNPTSMRVIMHDGTTTEYPNDYKGHGLRDQALEFERVVRSGAKSSAILTPDESILIMESLDEVRKQIGLIYPSER